MNEGKAGIAAYTDELRELGGIVTPATAAAADHFNDNLDKLKVATGGLALQLADKLLPTLISLTDQFVVGAKGGSGLRDTIGFVGDAIGAVVNTARAGVDILQAFTSAVTAIGAKGEELKARLIGNTKGADFYRELAEVARADTESQLKQASRRYDTPMPAAERSGLTQAGGNPRGRGVATGRADGARDRAVRSLYEPDAKKAAGAAGSKAKVDEVAQAYERMNAQMAETIALFGQTSEVAKLRYKLEHGELATLSKAQKDDLMQKAAIMDVQVKDADLLKKRNDLLEAEQQTRAQSKESAKEILADMQFELDLMGKTNAERVSAIELRRIGLGLTGEEIAAAKLSIESKATELDAVRKQIDALDEFRGSFADNVTDVLTGAESMGDAFKSLADTLVA